MNKENDYIVLKDGYNMTLIIAFIIVLVITGLLISTKFFLPDGRDKMTLNTDVNMTFRDTTVMLGDEYSWNEENLVAQMEFDERCINPSEETLNFKVMDQDKNTLPVNLIAGNPTPESEGSTVLVTDYILQFAMPENTYYVTVTVEKGDMNYSFSVDYRDFQKKDIVEYDKNYLKDTEALNAEIASVTAEKETLSNELNAINALPDDQKQEKLGRIDEINKRMQEIDNIVNADKRKIEMLNEGVS